MRISSHNKFIGNYNQLILSITVYCSIDIVYISIGKKHNSFELLIAYTANIVSKQGV
jgi:hypothetical protein